MSEEGYGYGKDIKYRITSDGIIDLDLSDSGDISLVGGGTDDSISIKRKNAVQTIVLRILTPFGSLANEEGQSIPYGSDLWGMIGAKNTDLNRMVARAYILSCLQDYEAIESIVGIDVEFPESGVMKIGLTIKLKDDDEILFETITIGAE